MTNSTKNFTYKPMRDIISTIIRTFFSLIGFFIMQMLINLVDHPDTPLISTWAGRIYLCIAIVIIGIYLLDIFTNTFNHLSIGVDEIVYRTGWLSQKTMTLSAYQIKSHYTRQGPLQKLCNTMDLLITTAGDSPEIVFHNISNGEIANQMMCELIRRYGRRNNH